MEPDASNVILTSFAFVLGALISPAVSVWLDSRKQHRERNILLRHKYEELANHISGCASWVEAVNTSMNTSGAIVLPLPQHAQNAVVLSHIYFHPLREVCENYLNSCVEYHRMLLENHSFAPGVSFGAQAAGNNRAAFSEATEHLHHCKHAAQLEIIQHAYKYTKA